MGINFNKLKPSASMEMARISNDLRQRGTKIYPLGIGDTHFSVPKTIQENFDKLNDAYSHYTNAQGIFELLDKISKFYQGYSPKDVMLVPGLKQGLYYTLAAISKKKVCILEPAWLGYEAVAIMAGYDIEIINTYSDNWQNKIQDINFDVILVCTPNNPDGKFYNKKEIDNLVNDSKKNNAWIVTDFIYDKYIYENIESERLEKIFNYEKLIIGNGFSKSHAMTGFRIGYLICKNQEIFNRMLIIHQNLATCVPSISQHILLNLEDSTNEIHLNSLYYKKNRDMVLEIFPEWEEFKPCGGFYYFVNLMIYGIDTGDLFCQQLLTNTGVVLIPGSSYGKSFQSYVRVSFSVNTELLIEALTELKKFINETKNN